MAVYASNKRATYDYEILEKIEGGLVLTGNEVKSIRTGHAKLGGAFVTFHHGEAMLTNAHIAPYRYALKDPLYSPTQPRKILLHQKQLLYLQQKSREAGLTIVPLSLYTKGRQIKIAIALAKGKKKVDKRQSIKKRELDREVRRAIRR